MVANEELSVTFIEAHASDVFCANVPEDALETAVCCVPDFNAFRMRCHKGVEDRIIEDAKTCLVIGKVVVSRLVVVVEEHPSTTSNNPLGWLSDGEAVDLVRWAVEGLHSRERAHVPDTEHA